LNNTEGAIKIGQSRETDNKSKQDEGKQNKNTTQYVLDTTISNQNLFTPSENHDVYTHVLASPAT
jgi:hypothetical protein